MSIDLPLELLPILAVFWLSGTVAAGYLAVRLQTRR